MLEFLDLPLYLLPSLDTVSIYTSRLSKGTNLMIILLTTSSAVCLYYSACGFVCLAFLCHWDIRLFIAFFYAFPPWRLLFGPFILALLNFLIIYNLFGYFVHFCIWELLFVDANLFIQSCDGRGGFCCQLRLCQYLESGYRLFLLKVSK